MLVCELIDELKKLNPDGIVFISNQQGAYVEANCPYENDEEEFESDNGEMIGVGDVVISFENT